MFPSSLNTFKPHFGAIFNKKSMDIELDEQGNVRNRVNGAIYPITQKELTDNYIPDPESPNRYHSKRGLWKDIHLKLPGTEYQECITVNGKTKIVPQKAINGILVRQDAQADDALIDLPKEGTFYEIPPFYALGVYEPAKGDVPAQKIYQEILNIAHVQGPIKSLEAFRHFATKMLFVNRPYALALAGYSEGPDKYAKHAQDTLTQVIDVLGRGNVGLVTSPTADQNSIDGVGTLLAQKLQIPLIYVTAEEYLQYIEPSKFPKEIQEMLYTFTEKFFFEDPGDYSEATAWATNACVVIGGRNAAVQDAVNALKHGNRVIIVNDSKIDRPAWDASRGRVENASKYLTDQIGFYLRTGRLRDDYGSVGGLTPEFLEKFTAPQNSLEKFIKVINLGEKGRDKVFKEQLSHLDAFIDGQAPLDL